MYVPALRGLPAAEVGHPNYQSPMRTVSEFGPDLDRFAAWVIYVSIVALAADPLLWSRYDGGDDRLLLGAADYQDPQRSRVFADLSRSSLAQLQPLVKTLSQFCGNGYTKLGTLETIAFGAATPTPQRSLVGTPPVAGRTGLPDWLKEGKTPSKPNHTGGAVPGRLDSRPTVVPPPPPRVGLPRLAYYGAFVAAVSLTIAVWYGMLLAGQALAVLMTALTGATTVLAIEHLRAPGRRKARELRNLVNNNKRTVNDARRAANRASAAVAEHERLRREQVQQWEAAERAAAGAEKTAVATAKADRDKQLAATRQQIAQLDRDLAMTVQSELEQIQRQHVTKYLQQIPLRRVDGVPDACTTEMKAQGLGDAAAWRGYTVGPGGHSGFSRVYLQTRRGPVYIRGIGQARAEHLERWRRQHERKAFADAPKDIPRQRRQQLEQDHATKRKALQDRLDSAERTAQGQIDMIVRQAAALRSNRQASRAQTERTLVEKADRLDEAWRTANDDLTVSQATVRKDHERPSGVRRHLLLVVPPTGRRLATR
jgi:hypothetical protein